MNSSTKLLSGIALLLSLTAYASAGAMDDLKGNVPEVKLELPVTAAEAVTPAPRQVDFQYLTGVRKSHVAEFVSELFVDDLVMGVGIAKDSVVKLPAMPIVSDLYDCNGFTVMATGDLSELPSVFWSVTKEYKVIESEIPAALSYLLEQTEKQVIEILRGPNDAFTISFKTSPWQ